AVARGAGTRRHEPDVHGPSHAGAGRRGGHGARRGQGDAGRRALAVVTVAAVGTFPLPRYLSRATCPALPLERLPSRVGLRERLFERGELRLDLRQLRAVTRVERRIPQFLLKRGLLGLHRLDLCGELLELT